MAECHQFVFPFVGPLFNCKKKKNRYRAGTPYVMLMLAKTHGSISAPVS
jgi:hypothetical protein